MSKNKVTLGCAAIVKNEAYVIKEALLTCKDLFDEFFILDTGSTDGTQAVLTEAGIKWQQVHMTGDVSAMRNEAIKQVQSDWILMLDADEVIAPEAVAAIRNLIASAEHDAYWINQCDCPRGQRSSVVSCAVPRLFRRSSGVHYGRPTNETFIDHQGQLPPLRVVPVCISHWGNIAFLEEFPEKKQEKLNIKIGLMAEWLKSHPQDTEGWIYIGQVYAIIGDYKKYYECFDRAFGSAKPGVQKVFVLEQLCVAADKLRDLDKLFMVCRILQEADPENAIALYHLSMLAIAQGHVEQGMDGLITMIDCPVPDRRPYRAFTHYFSRLRYVTLGKLFEQRGEWRKARKVYEHGAQHFGDAMVKELLQKATEAVGIGT